MMPLKIKTPCAQDSSSFNYSRYVHFYLPSISMTCSSLVLFLPRQSLLFDITPHSTQPYYPRPSFSSSFVLPFPFPASYVVPLTTSTSFPAHSLRLLPLSLSLLFFDILSRQAIYLITYIEIELILFNTTMYTYVNTTNT